MLLRINQHRIDYRTDLFVELSIEWKEYYIMTKYICIKVACFPISV